MGNAHTRLSVSTQVVDTSMALMALTFFKESARIVNKGSQD